MKTLCVFASETGVVADAILCDSCKKTVADDSEKLYEQIVYDDDEQDCDFCGGEVDEKFVEDFLR